MGRSLGCWPAGGNGGILYASGVSFCSHRGFFCSGKSGAGGNCRYRLGCCRDLQRIIDFAAVDRRNQYLPRLWLQISRGNGADRAALAKLLAAGSASAAAERRAVGAAGAWFDRRIGPIAGTVGHVARANREYMFDKRQMDCIDTSRNTTSLLLVLAQLNLLRHHTVAEPEARGYLIDGRAPHATAVLVEKATGTKWAVDSWTRAYGQAPEIMPLTQWMTLN